MPSGGHGSRGGRSGGFSRGSSSGSRGRSFSSSRHVSRHTSLHHPMHHHHRHIRIRIGGRYYGYGDGVSPVVALLLFFIIFVGMITLGTGMSRGSLKDEMNFYESQHVHYKGMIDYAKEHEEYIVKANVTARWYDEYSGKYWLDYEIETGGEPLKGYTYPCYTLSQTNGLVGKEIDVAVDGLPITQYTDSVDLAFENVGLEDDADYMSAKDSYKSTNTTFVITLTITILLIVVLVWYSIKRLQLEEDDNKEKKVISPSTGNSKSYCRYCGSAYSNGENKCSSCGANLKD